MKRCNRYIAKFLLLVCLLAIGNHLFAQDYDEQGKEIMPETFPRRALVGPDCMVNTMWNVLSIAESTKGMNNFLDEDLNNSVEFRSLANVEIINEELIRVKDRRHIYRKGTPVGFCLEVSGGLLDVGALQIFNINYYYKGEIVGSATASDGGSGGSLLDLDLIQLETNAVTMITATETNYFNGSYFDEIGLSVSGLDAGLLKSLGIRYAFAGEVTEKILSEDMDGIGSMTEIHDNWGGFINILGGYGKKGSFIDNDKDSYLLNTIGAGVTLITGGLRVGASWTGKKITKGTEIGFVFEDAGLLSVGVGASASIRFNDDKNQEILVDASVLGLSVIGANTVKLSVIAPKDFDQVELRLTLGDILGVDAFKSRKFYYMYINEPPIVDSPCHIDDLGMDASICGSETEYQLSPTEGITWSLEKVTQDQAGEDIMSEETEQEKENVKIVGGKVTGISPNVEGFYHFKATSDSGCEDWLVLRHGVQASTSSCNTPITGDGYEIAQARNAEGGIVILNSIKNRENVIDNDPDNYAEMMPGIKLLSSDYIVGVHKKDGTFSDGQEAKRVGFIADVPTNVLTLNALQFFHIKLYNDGKPVGDESYVVEDWNVISAGLIGSDGASKSRLGVTIPSGVAFDEFSLWSSGVASANLSALRVYSALVENESDACDNPLMGCEDAVIVGAGALEDASINYDRTGFPALVNAGVVLSGLENLLSGEREIDREKYAYGYATLGVAGSMQVSIKFGRTLTANHQVGFVVDRETFLLGADVIGVTQINSYYSKGTNPDEPVETKSDWSVLGADVIGYGDYAYLMFNATQPFDEIQFISAAGVGLSNSTKIYSVFVRTDADGDGIPDCMDPTPCDGDISNMEISSDVCTGDEIILSGIANFKEGETVDYKVEAIDRDNNNSVTISDSYTVGQGTFKLSFKIENAGRYNVQLTSTEGDVITWPLLTVHPREATWKGTSNDWNNWSNWDNGAPWSCTNVIIPTNGENGQPISNYPILTKDVQNPCNYIHFEPHAEVVNTPYLTYNKAWVEIELEPNRYYMVATPIKGIYSGDWFISKEGTNLPAYFTDLTEENYPANRVTPTIYQRLWEHTAQNKLATGGDGPVTISETKWTAPYNHMATSYEKRNNYDFNALSVWVHSGTPDGTEAGTPDGTEATTSKTSYKFRFPKMHTTYFYSDMDGNILGLSNNLKRDTTAGRFIYEDENGEADFPITMTYNNELYGEEHKVFLAGNPFMSHIDIEKFFDKNDHIKSIKVESTDGNYSSVVQNDNTIIAGSGDTKLQYIPPMQSFFVELSSTDEYNDECEITYTEGMLVGKPKATGQLRSSSPSDALYLSASASGQRSSAMLRFSASASDYYHEGEDADILIDDEVPPAVAVFTVADSHALDIQQRASGGDIPIGFVLPKSDEVTLCIDVPEEYAGWVLNDLETGKNYALRSGTNELELGRMLTNIGRFSLRGSAPTGNEVISASQPRIYCFREEGGNTLVVRSAEGMMARCEIYTLAGQLSGVASYETNEYRLPVPPGIKIVKVHFTDGITSTIKTY